MHLYQFNYIYCQPSYLLIEYYRNYYLNITFYLTTYFCVCSKDKKVYINTAKDENLNMHIKIAIKEYIYSIYIREQKMYKLF